jgi:hypothetical protein
MRRATACTLVAVLVVLTAVAAEARVRAKRDAHAVANAFMRKGDLQKPGADADFIVMPPQGHPAGVSNRKIAKFPTRGSHFSILSTGNVKASQRKNKGGALSHDNKGPVVRGTRDAVMLRVKFRVPEGKNCLSFEFKFLSEEFPEFVDSEFNDAFVAELDKTTWDSDRDDPVVDSPRNFARDAKGNPIRVNTVGPASVKSKWARGTTYDAATRTLRAQTRVNSGAKHYLFLSIFDQGDRQYDSAVFLDGLSFRNRSSCKSGVVVS